MLLHILHHTAARAFKNSTALLLTHLKLDLFGPFSPSPANTPRPSHRRCGRQTHSHASPSNEPALAAKIPDSNALSRE